MPVCHKLGDGRNWRTRDVTDRSFCFSLSIISFFFVVVGTNNFVLYQYCSWIFFFHSHFLLSSSSAGIGGIVNGLPKKGTGYLIKGQGHCYLG